MYTSSGFQRSSRASSPQISDTAEIRHLLSSGGVQHDILQRLLVGQTPQEVPNEETALGVVAGASINDLVKAVVANADGGRICRLLLGRPEDADGVASVVGRLEVAGTRAGRDLVLLLVRGTTRDRVPESLTAAFRRCVVS